MGGLVVYVCANVNDPSLQYRLGRWARRVVGVTPSVVLTEYQASLGSEHALILTGLALQNRSDVPAKDIKLTCKLFAPSGTELGELTNMLFKRIPAKSSLRISQPWHFGTAHEQTEHVTCAASGAMQTE
jgi:hypothetical protein